LIRSRKRAYREISGRGHVGGERKVILFSFFACFSREGASRGGEILPFSRISSTLSIIGDEQEIFRGGSHESSILSWGGRRIRDQGGPRSTFPISTRITGKKKNFSRSTTKGDMVAPCRRKSGGSLLSFSLRSGVSETGRRDLYTNHRGMWGCRRRPTPFPLMVRKRKKTSLSLSCSPKERVCLLSFFIH